MAPAAAALTAVWHGERVIRLSYRLGWQKRRAPVPVVVVGNLTAGGNGKTPVVIWLVEQLQQRGIRVGVVSRGYGGKAERYPLVLDDRTSTAQAGDEPVLIHQRTGAPVAVAPLRSDAVKALLSAHDLQMIVTDDGLQHYKLARDREIVVIDGVRRFGNGWWLPAGPMRERASRLQSVDAVIVNGGVARPGEIPMRLRPWMAVNLLTGERRDVSTLRTWWRWRHRPSAALLRHPRKLRRPAGQNRGAGGPSGAEPDDVAAR